MHDDDRVLSDGEARRLWQRAADLQAEAARRLEERSRALVRSDRAGARGETGERGEDPDGYRLADVRQAATEAGISAEFVDLALAEDGAGREVASRADRWADRFLGEGPRALVVSRTFEQSAAEVYGAMQRVFPRHQLSLIDSRGGEPLAGGVLVFELPVLTQDVSNSIVRDLYWWADVREIHVRIQPLEEGRCEVTLRAPTGRARRVNLAVGGGLAGLLGLVTAAGAAALATPFVVLVGLGAGAEAAAVALAGGLGLGAGGGVGTLAWRGSYRWGQRKGEAALARLLQALVVDLRIGGAFPPPGSPASPPPTSPPPLPPGSGSPSG